MMAMEASRIPDSSITIYSLTWNACFSFVYIEDERNAEDAIRGLDNIEFGRQRRRLSVEWARFLFGLIRRMLPWILLKIYFWHGDRGVRHREEGVMRPANTKPTKTLFVINSDPLITRVRDLERHFEPYGKLLHVRIRRNFAFIQYETQEEATKALECTHMSKLLDRVISVEYAIRDDDDRNGQREIPGRRGGYGRRVSAGYDRSVSPIYGKQARRLSPDYDRKVRRLSLDYGRAPSPFYKRYRDPVNDRIHSPIFDRYHSRSPVRRPRTGRIY